MKIRIPARFLSPTWDMPTWDAAYNIILRAGKGEEMSVKFLADLKTGATAGNVHAVRVKTAFDAAAKLVSANLPKPSTFVAQQRRRSPLLPGGRPAGRGAAQPLAATVKKQAQQLAEMKRQQLERARRGKLMGQAQQRMDQERAAHDVEMANAEAALDMLHRQLERRELADEVRAKLEDQAEHYEAIIEKLKTPSASGEAATTSEAMAAEQPEAEQDDSSGAYPSGVPGDVEFSNAGV